MISFSKLLNLVYAAESSCKISSTNFIRVCLLSAEIQILPGRQTIKMEYLK